MKFVSVTEEHYLEIASLVASPEELYLVSPKSQYPWSVEQIKSLARNRQNLTVCLVDGVVAAFANLYEVSLGKSAFIGNVIVSDIYKGQGIGKALVRYMMNLCETEYRAEAHLSVFAFNSLALLMYTDLGFVPYQVEPRESLSGTIEALIHMRASKT